MEITQRTVRCGDLGRIFRLVYRYERVVGQRHSAADLRRDDEVNASGRRRQRRGQ